jgi:CCR4-NOT transcription complex subunit 3
MSNNNSAMENHMNNNNVVNNNSLSNCVSPTSNQSTAVSGRTSPTSLMSPQQQILNGSKQQLGAPSQGNNATDPSNESMSTLKTIAQEVVNRSTVNQVQTPPPLNMSQQQLQQHQQQYNMDATSLDTSSTATGQNGLNANINSLINATNMSSANMKSSGTNEALIPPLLGVAPLGPSPLQKDHQVQVS